MSDPAPEQPATGRPKFAAHSPNDAGQWQSMTGHAQPVADQAREWAERFGAGELAYWAGLLHDLGKYSPEFQKYLDDCHEAARKKRPAPPPGTAPHKQAGAVYAGRHVTPILLPIILGHHGGMPSLADGQAEHRKFPAEALAELARRAAEDCPELRGIPNLNSLVERRITENGKPDPRAAEMLMRMVFSCLVDADSLDTERHFSPAVTGLRSRPAPTVPVLRDALAEAQAELLAESEDTTVNRVRREVYEACLAAATEPAGVFRLTVPTGGGKTRSSLAFALEHAACHGLERVIYAIPYTSIVDQTAEVFEKIFNARVGAGAVLEHHSAIEPDEQNPHADYLRRLACQNWDAPLIVTTTVQLFESLFGNRPGRSRKVHRLARAVIVLDEVQSLPPKLLRPIVDGLRELCRHFGTTVLLCTATQPALGPEVLDHVGLTEIREIIPDPPRLFQNLRRVSYDVRPATEPWSWDETAAAMRQQRACLAIVNTRKDALALLDALQDRDALHLSTLLCGRHRRDQLAEIRRRLEAREPCRVVATQVVECGCDLDFPLVLRAIGPLDRIVQAAGRCNREGRWSADESRVIVFRPAEGGQPRGSYKVAMGEAIRELGRGVDLHLPAVYESYFRKIYALDELDAKGVQKARKELNFPAIAEALRLIEDETVGVLVRYEAALRDYEAVLAEVNAAGAKLSRQLWRRVQPFLVSVRKHDFEQFKKRGLVNEAAPDSGLFLWHGGYDSVRGLNTDAPDPADLIR